MFRYDMLEKGIKSLDQNPRENLREREGFFSTQLYQVGRRDY